MFNMDNNSIFSSNNQDITNSINDTGMDLPPELGEIKELSDAPIAKAPTMEVLSPMNIIPEEFDGNNILDNYDAGIINPMPSLELNENNNELSHISTNVEPKEEYNNFNSYNEPSSFDFSTTFNNYTPAESSVDIEESKAEKQPASLAAEVFDRVVSKIKDKGYDVEIEKYDNDKQIKLEIIIKK